MEEAVSEDMTAHADRRTEGAVQKGARPAQTQQRQKQRQGGKKQKKKIYGQRPDFKGVIWI